MRALLDHVARLRAGAEDARGFWSSLDYLAVEAPAAGAVAVAGPAPTPAAPPSSVAALPAIDATAV